MSVGKNNKLIFGVGENDLDSPVHVDTEQGKVICRIYETWYSMIRRCYSPVYHAKKPTYIDCEVVDSWKKLSNFKDWMVTQDYHGKQLDKDLLVKGNRLYSPENCIFIEKRLNGFLMDGSKGRTSKLPGVSLKTRPNGKQLYVAQAQNPFTGKNAHLGYYEKETEAHRAWLDYKHELACRYAEEQTDTIVAQALMRYFKESD